MTDFTPMADFIPMTNFTPITDFTPIIDINQGCGSANFFRASASASEI